MLGEAEQVLSTYQSQSSNIVGPFIRYCGIDLSQGLWYGTILVITNSSSPPPSMTLTGGPSPREYSASLLCSCSDSFFWRFDLTCCMGNDSPIRYEYTISGCSPRSFYVAGVQQKQWRWAFTSCNGFSSNVPLETRDQMGGIPALWNDMMQKHDVKPFLALVGGGDQIYCDAVWKLSLLVEWLSIKGKENRSSFPWDYKLESQVQNFYLDTYRKHFIIPGFSDAFATIPTLNVIDDHDTWDGMGSYPEYLETSNIFKNVKRIAYKYYLLFQHHTTPELALKEGYIGCAKGSYSLVKLLGSETAIAMIDARGERTVNRILSDETWNDIFTNLNHLPATVKHLIFVTGVPVIYPRMEIADNILGNMGKVKRSINKGFNKVVNGIGQRIGTVFGRRAKDEFGESMESLKKGMGKTGLMSSLLNQFGEPELMDDLIDHWTNKTHEDERLLLVERLQSFARDKIIRVTFLAGDVHCGGAGKFFPKDVTDDHLLMYQIISSAIANVPPPNAVLIAVHRSAKEYELNEKTLECMLNLFEKDVDGKKLSCSKLIGRRNWCLFEGIDDRGGALITSLQVENVDWRKPSIPYSLVIQPVSN